MIQTYLMVNKDNNICEDSCMWDGNTQTWQPPEIYLMFIQATTPAMVWGLNPEKTDYILVEKIGEGRVNYIWDGTALITNDPKPNLEMQPTTDGTQQI